MLDGSVPISAVSKGPGLYGDLAAIDPAIVEASESSDNLRQVTFALEGRDFDPAVDPSGDRLVFASTQHRSTADLYIKYINGSAVTQLTSDPANDVMPTFSPDGQRVAFASDRSGNWDIYMMAVNGGPAVQLTDDASQDMHPSFSPDGTKLVYSSLSSQSNQWELVVIDLNSPQAKRYIGPGQFPEWSPIDDQIVYQRAQQRGANLFSIWTLELVNEEGVRPTQVVVTPQTASINPCWSPDGNLIAYSTVTDPGASQGDRPPRADIWIANADGSGRVNLTRSRYSNLQPVWSPDGTILFRSDRAENRVENVWSLHPGRALQTIEPMLQPKTASAPTGEGP